MLGLLVYDYSLFNGVFVLIGSFIGLHYISKYVKRTGHQSILVIFLGLVIVVAFISIVILSGRQILADYKSGLNIIAFTPICPSS